MCDAWRQALQKGGGHLLVFEDDVMVRPELGQEVLRKIGLELQRYVQEHPDFDIIQLGWCVGGPGPKLVPCLYHAAREISGYEHIHPSRCVCLHAVVYSDAFMKRFLASTLSTFEHAKRHVDEAIFHAFPGKYVLVNPGLFTQHWCVDPAQPYAYPVCLLTRVANIDTLQSRMIAGVPYVWAAFHILLLGIAAIPLCTSALRWNYASVAVHAWVLGALPSLHGLFRLLCSASITLGLYRIHSARPARR